MKKQISVTGYISGDYESFCLDVKDSDYEKIKNKQPIEDRKSFFNENRYRLYIKEIFNKLNIEKGGAYYDNYRSIINYYNNDNMLFNSCRKI